MMENRFIFSCIIFFDSIFKDHLTNVIIKAIHWFLISALMLTEINHLVSSCFSHHCVKTCRYLSQLDHKKQNIVWNYLFLNVFPFQESNLIVISFLKYLFDQIIFYFHYLQNMLVDMRLEQKHSTKIFNSNNFKILKKITHLYCWRSLWEHWMYLTYSFSTCHVSEIIFFSCFFSDIFLHVKNWND